MADELTKEPEPVRGPSGGSKGPNGNGDSIDEVRVYGRQTPFEEPGRSESRADLRTYSFSISGKYTDLVDKNVKPRDSLDGSWLADYLGNLNNLYVRTVELVEEEGGWGRMKISAVMCPDGLQKPFQVTYEVNMEEVQKRLICHPLFRVNPNDTGAALKAKNKTLLLIRYWEDTQENLRYGVDKDGEMTFQYTIPPGRPGAGVDSEGNPNPGTIDDENALKYCKAVTAGIETFNLYLPVVTKVSTYLQLPGITYDSETGMIDGGTLEDISDKVGQFDDSDDMGIDVKGFTDASKGRWFKAQDTYVGNADGTWTRTEKWVYTNDLSHEWIYDWLNQGNQGAR